MQPLSCTVTETLNGEWELTLVHPIDDNGHWQRLTEGRILRAPVPAAMTPQVGLVTQQYQTSTYDILIYRVTTQRDPLHLRSGTGTNYRILGRYKKGTEIIVLNQTTSDWYEVTCPDGKHGYMASRYLTYVRTDTGYTQTNVGFQNQTVTPRQLRDQPFRIYRVVPELDKVVQIREGKNLTGITALSTAVASMVQADIGTADIDFAHVKDLTADTAIITKGVNGKLYVADLAVTEANMTSLTVGELVVKGSDGHFYSVSVDGEGQIQTTLKQIAKNEIG